jgi:ELWxxDGT repeat protein
LVPDPELASPKGFVETGAGTSFFLDRGSFGDAALELWGSDGTPTGTGPLAEIAERADVSRQVFVTPGPEPGSATFMYQVDTSSIDIPSGLYSTDGTSGGTRALGSLGLGEFTSVLGLVAAGDRTFLVLLEEGSNSASILLATDGTPGGTRELFRIDNPFDHSFISEIAPAGDRLYFTGDDPVAGREVWVTDGTPEGTRRVANIAPGRAGSAPSDLFAFGNRLFFGADDGTHGRELWVTDGTAAGTRQIEIRPGPRGSYPQAFSAVGDHVVFAADDGVHGLEMWVSDGMKAGTRLVADVQPGELGSCPVGFAAFGSNLYFSAGRPNVGYELFRVPASALDLP